MYCHVTGCPVGTILSMPLSGVMSKYGFDGGWASVFYCFGKRPVLVRTLSFSPLYGLNFNENYLNICAFNKLLLIGLLGAIGLLWFFVWQLAIHGSPSEHPTITPEERDYIEESIAKLPKAKVND